MALRSMSCVLALGLLIMTGCASRQTNYQPACRPAVVATAPVAPACPPTAVVPPPPQPVVVVPPR